jgi:hypothetical protein
VTGVFADSFFLIALLNPADQLHEAAKPAQHWNTAPLITTDWVLVEQDRR